MSAYHLTLLRKDAAKLMCPIPLFPLSSILIVKLNLKMRRREKRQTHEQDLVAFFFSLTFFLM